jgi:hypothetical protein
MRSTRAFRLLTVVCISGALAACSDATVPPESVADEVITTDLALAAGDAIATDVAFLVAAELDGMRIGTPVGPPPNGDRPPLNCSLGTDGRHTCVGQTPNGLSITRTFGFYDANGVIHTEFDEVSTASINFTLSVSGTISRDGHTATISRQRNQTLSGLAGAESQRTWDGVGTGSHNGSGSGPRGSRSHAMTSNDTTSGVTFAVPRSENPWPLSGSIVHNMTSTVTVDGARTGSRTINRRAKVTFNGTSIVPLEIGNRTCTLDLQARSVSCPDRS